MDITEVIIARRHRKDLGDMEELKRSISELGLLQPIVVRKGTKELVAGYRRLKALEELGISALVEGTHVNLIDIDSLVRGEHDENVCRKDFTLSEKVAIFEAVKEEQLRISIARQITGGCSPTDLRIKDRDSGDPPAARGSDTPGARNAPGTLKAAWMPKPGKRQEKIRSGPVSCGEGGRASSEYPEKGHQRSLPPPGRSPADYGHLVREMDLTGRSNLSFKIGSGEAAARERQVWDMPSLSGSCPTGNRESLNSFAAPWLISR